MTEPALRIESLYFSVRDTPILRNVSLTVNRGETLSIIGPNGAGKSTLLKCLMRINRGWTGQVRLLGRPLSSYSQRELARRMAYVPQAGGDDRMPYTVADFVRMGRYPYAGPFGSFDTADRLAVEKALDRAGVRDLAHRMMGTLSGGERQKVFIAGALAQEGEILLLDEPTAFLDYRHQAEVAGILRRANRDSGVTILTVTHDVNAAILGGGRVLALCQGRVAWWGSSEDLADATLLRGIFDADFRFLDDPVTGMTLVAPQGANR